MTKDEGYIKFNLEWIKQTLPVLKESEQLIHWRNKLYDLGLIGMYEDGIGFGNISCRIGKTNTFLITGTQTGNLEKITTEYLTGITDYDISQNYLLCEGPVKASSESLTHAAIYEQEPTINAVIHIHHDGMWNALKYKIPTSSAKIPYGTPEMAGEIKRLFREEDLHNKKMLAMAGHKGGLIAIGKDLNEAGSVLLNYFSSFNTSENTSSMV